MSDEQVDPSDLSPLLKEATAAKGKPLTEKERRKFEALEANLRKCEQEVEALQMQQAEDSSGADPVNACRRPKPEDFGLPASDVQSIEKAIKGGMRVNRFLSWLLYALAILGGVVVWKASNGLYALTPFFWFILMGLTASDSKRLIKLWNYRQRRLIDAYYRFEIAWWSYFRQLEKASFEFWESLSGREFEFEMANLFRTHGYTVDVTGGSGDKGVDLAMTKGDRCTVVQCKRYKNRANPAVVRELYGTLTAIGAHDAILVCTGGFTSGVYNFVRDKPIQLIDMDGILALQNLTVETYGFYDSNSTQ